MLRPWERARRRGNTNRPPSPPLPCVRLFPPPLLSHNLLGRTSLEYSRGCSRSIVLPRHQTTLLTHRILMTFFCSLFGTYLHILTATSYSPCTYLTAATPLFCRFDICLSEFRSQRARIVFFSLSLLASPPLLFSWSLGLSMVFMTPRRVHLRQQCRRGVLVSQCRRLSLDIFRSFLYNAGQGTSAWSGRRGQSWSHRLWDLWVIREGHGLAGANRRWMVMWRVISGKTGRARDGTHPTASAAGFTARRTGTGIGIGTGTWTDRTGAAGKRSREAMTMTSTMTTDGLTGTRDPWVIMIRLPRREQASIYFFFSFGTLVYAVDGRGGTTTTTTRRTDIPFPMSCM